jgi:hypothetical protein
VGGMLSLDKSGEAETDGVLDLVRLLQPSAPKRPVSPSNSRRTVRFVNLTSHDLPLTLYFAESGVQYWTGHGGYDGSDSRRRVHGGKAEAGTGDGYTEPRKSFTDLLEFRC